MNGLNICVDDVIVKQVRTLKYLDPLLNDTLTWSDRVGMVCGRVNCSLNLLLRLSWFLPLSLLFTFLKFYILPHFDYLMLSCLIVILVNLVDWKYG